MILPPMPGNAWLRWGVVERLMPEGETLLEIGPGAGAISARLAKRYSYTGVDRDRESATLAHERVRPHGGRVIYGEINDVDGAFDVVCAFEVLEHVEDDVSTLRAWGERLHPGGQLLLTVPAHQHLWGANDVLAHHHRRYSRDGLVDTLQKGGFRLVEMQMLGGPVGHLLKRARDWRADRMLARSDDAVEATRGTGRSSQPSALGGLLWWAMMVPGRWAQLPFTNTEWGTGLAVLARPSAASGMTVANHS